MAQMASKSPDSTSTATAKARRYTHDFKLSAVRMVLVEGHSHHKVAEKLQVSHLSVKAWVEQLSGSVVAQPGPNGENVTTELQRLRAENRQLREDNDFLKRASKYFACQSR